MRKAWQSSGTLPPRVDIDAAYHKTAERLGLAPGDATEMTFMV